MNHHTKKILLTFSAVIVLGAAGCGRSPGTVKGTVTFKNKPLAVARITFIGEKGSVQGDVIDGSFTVARVPLGDNVKVTVSTQSLYEQVRNFEYIQQQVAGSPLLPKNKELPPELQGLKGGTQIDEEQVKMMKDMKARLVPLPTRYQTEKTTPLSYPISSGEQEIEIKLD
jgi:hypothetical protein